MSLGGAKPSSGVITTGGIVLNDFSKTVTVDGEPVTLTPTEFDILKLLMKNPGVVFSSSKIYSEVWNDKPIGAENTIAVHIRHIREKVEINPAEPRYLKVVWGQGYKIEGGGKA
jgi:DNA-binding response OmpR family regulator